MFDDVTAVVVTFKPVHDGQPVPLRGIERFDDARRVSFDSHGNLFLYADHTGSSLVGAVAGDAWLSYRLERAAPSPEPDAPAVERDSFQAAVASTNEFIEAATAEPSRLLHFPTERRCSDKCCQGAA